MIKKEFKIEQDNGIGYSQMPPKDIFAYNELRSCSDLFGLHERDVLDIQPEFQRNEVWPPAYQARFIDSLLKELPIPSMCFSYDKDRNEMRVIDGLQRMICIIKFLDVEKEWKLSKLKDIDPKISGKTNVQIKSENQTIYNNIQNLSLPVTFLRVNHGKSNHNEYLFQIFHRLNTYGKKLNDQEIRNCIFSGPFNTLIKKLDKDANWKKLLNITSDNRFLKAELILRFFAFYDDYKNYEGILTKFLNDYMSTHRNEKENDIKKKELLFKKVIALIFEKISDKNILPRRASNAFVEALLFGVSKNIFHLDKLDATVVKEYYQKLNNDKYFKEKNLLEGTMKKQKVFNRLRKSSLIFSGK